MGNEMKQVIDYRHLRVNSRRTMQRKEACLCHQHEMQQKSCITNNRAQTLFNKNSTRPIAQLIFIHIVYLVQR